MGEQKVDERSGDREFGVFMKHLLRDVHALERMLRTDMFESGVRRIGAEQELFIVNRQWQPAPVSLQVLGELQDSRFTTELAQFNLEFNLDPVLFGGDCLHRLERQLAEQLERARRAAAAMDCEIVLAGILPTIRKSDLSLENMTPKPRYFALNDAMGRLRGSDYEFNIRGIDELFIRHDSVMLESCNASFQLHFQVAPEEFAKLYNIAQLVSAPLLAGATNSPLLFGRRLWRETRIAVFQQAVDTRRATPYLRESKGRVSFGTRWVEESVLIDLAANLMDWERIRHIPVEDGHHRLVGLISYRSVLRYYGRQGRQASESMVRVSEIMKSRPVTVTPQTTTVAAIRLMRANKIGCLPVVEEGRLVGMVTERDFMEIAGELLEKGLEAETLSQSRVEGGTAGSGQ